jgi:hypothetical protein
MPPSDVLNYDGLSCAPRWGRFFATRGVELEYILPYVGDCSCPCSQPRVSTDFIGSTDNLWTCSHFGHSKVRRSEWAGPGSIRASIMRPGHLGQRGRSIGSSDGWVGAMVR